MRATPSMLSRRHGAVADMGPSPTGEPPRRHGAPSPTSCALAYRPHRCPVRNAGDNPGRCCRCPLPDRHHSCLGARRSTRGRYGAASRHATGRLVRRVSMEPMSPRPGGRLRVGGRRPRPPPLQRPRPVDPLPRPCPVDPLPRRAPRRRPRPLSVRRPCGSTVSARTIDRCPAPPRSRSPASTTPPASRPCDPVRR